MPVARFLRLSKRRNALLCFQNLSAHSAVASLCLPLCRLCRFHCRVFHFLVSCCIYFLCILISTAAGIRPDPCFCTCGLFCYCTLILVFMPWLFRLLEILVIEKYLLFRFYNILQCFYLCHCMQIMFNVL